MKWHLNFQASMISREFISSIKNEEVIKLWREMIIQERL